MPWRQFQRTPRAWHPISPQTHAQALPTSSARNPLSWDSSPNPQKYAHGVVLKILTSRIHDEAKPKPDILGRGWGSGQGTECLPDPLTPGGKIHSRKHTHTHTHTLGTPSAVVCYKRHRLSRNQTEGQLGSCPTRHTSWQKRKSFLKSPAHLHMCGSLKVASLGSILELF